MSSKAYSSYTIVDITDEPIYDIIGVPEIIVFPADENGDFGSGDSNSISATLNPTFRKNNESLDNVTLKTELSASDGNGYYGIVNIDDVILNFDVNNKKIIMLGGGSDSATFSLILKEKKDGQLVELYKKVYSVVKQKQGETGAAAQDFNITASSYFFSLDNSENPQGAITLTAELINIDGIAETKIEWYKNGDIIEGATGFTYGATSPGTYKAKIKEYDWQDSVTLGTIPNPEAIGLTLSNPSMTFNSLDEDGYENCSVIAQIGSTPIAYSSSAPTETSTGWCYTITIDEEQGISKDENGVLTVTKPASNTDESVTFTVDVYLGNTNKRNQTMSIRRHVINQKFDLWASSYSFLKKEDNTYRNKITLKVNMTALSGTIYWYNETNRIQDDNGDITGDTYTAKQPGTYKAWLYNGTESTEWFDSVVLGETEDGIDAYTINVSGENVQIAETEVKALKDSDKKLLSTMTIEALKGTAAQNITITKIGASSVSADPYTPTSIAGLYYTLSEQNPKKPTLSFYCSSALAADGQTIIEFTVDNKSFTKTFSFAISEQGEQGPQGLPVKDLILSSTATEVQVSLNDGGTTAYSPELITITAEPKNLGNGAFSWVLIDGNGDGLEVSDTDSSIEVPILQEYVTNNPLPWTIQVTYQETGGEPYTRSVTITCPRQIISQEQIVDLDIYYAGSDNSYSAPVIEYKNAENNSNWSTDEPEANWIWKSIRKKTYWKYYYSDAPSTPIETDFQYEWSEPELTNSNAAEIKAFNTLTNNSKFKGHFYGVYVWVKEEENKDPTAYFYETAGATKLLIVPKDSDLAKNTLYIEKINGKWDRANSSETEVNGEDGQTLKNYLDYYVNASMIQTGSLLVGTQDEPIFKAGFDDDKVKIAGFDVDTHSLQITPKWYVAVYWIDDQYPVFVLRPGEEAEAEIVELLDQDLDAKELYVRKDNDVTVSTNQDPSGTKVKGDASTSPTDVLQLFKYQTTVYLGTDAIKLGGNNTNPVFSVNNKGEMQMTKGSIKLGTKSNDHHPFEVNDQGEMYSVSGKIGGWDITRSSLESTIQYSNISTRIDMRITNPALVTIYQYYYCKLKVGTEPNSSTNWTDIGDKLDAINNLEYQYGYDFWIKVKYFDFSNPTNGIEKIYKCCNGNYDRYPNYNSVQVFYYPSITSLPPYPTVENKQWKPGEWLTEIPAKPKDRLWSAIIGWADFQLPSILPFESVLPVEVFIYYPELDPYTLTQGISIKGTQENYNNNETLSKLSLFTPKIIDVNDNEILVGSPIRFFAGNKNNNLASSTFAVLEDGSMYFDRARIMNPQTDYIDNVYTVTLLYFDCWIGTEKVSKALVCQPYSNVLKVIDIDDFKLE